MVKNIGAAVPFPWKLHEMLAHSEQHGHEDVVGWFPGGTAFKVFKIEAFVNGLMRQCFNQTKYKSFQRQLNIWGFQRITEASDPKKGAYHHPLFLKGKSYLCYDIHRIASKSPGLQEAMEKRPPSAESSIRLSAHTDKCLPSQALAVTKNQSNHQRISAYANMYPSAKEVLLGNDHQQIQQPQNPHPREKNKPNSISSTRAVGIVPVFLLKLHNMLEFSEEHNLDHIVAWLPGGTAFKVFKPDLFAFGLLRDFFNHKSFKSFQSQLSSWGFTEIIEVNDSNRGGYLHPLFRKDQPLELAFPPPNLNTNSTPSVKAPDGPPSQTLPDGNEQPNQSTRATIPTASNDSFGSLYQQLPASRCDAPGKNRGYFDQSKNQTNGMGPEAKSSLTPDEIKLKAGTKASPKYPPFQDLSAQERSRWNDFATLQQAPARAHPTDEAQRTSQVQANLSNAESLLASRYDTSLRSPLEHLSSLASLAAPRNSLHSSDDLTKTRLALHKDEIAFIAMRTRVARLEEAAVRARTALEEFRKNRSRAVFALSEEERRIDQPSLDAIRELVSLRGSSSEAEPPLQKR